MTQPEIDLIHSYLDGTIGETDFACLQSLLRDNAEARRMLRSLSTVDAKWQELAAANPETLRLLATPAASPRVPGRHPAWLSWRPLTAAAAGLIIGLFGAAAVFAYAMPPLKAGMPKVMPLLTESFEDASLIPGRGFPLRADGWSGDLSVVIASEVDVQPKEGDRVARLPPHSRRKFSYATRLVDLAAYPLPPGAVSRQVEVTASFCGADSGSTDRYQIRLAALSEEPGEVKAIWNGDNLLDQVLLHVGRTITVKPGDHGWQTVQATMEIPRGARSLVISLAAAVADDSMPKTVHFLDDVQARFVIHMTQP